MGLQATSAFWIVCTAHYDERLYLLLPTVLMHMTTVELFQMRNFHMWASLVLGRALLLKKPDIVP